MAGSPRDSFDLVGCAQRSIERVIEEKGLKVLLLDDRTQDIISMSYSFSDMLSKDLYLLDKLDNDTRTKQGYLKALVLVRPTGPNIAKLCKELRDPLYGDYYLFFTNIVPDEALNELALADEHEVVKQVNELYLDYLPLHPYAFISDVRKPLMEERDYSFDTSDALIGSVLGVLLSVRKRPVLRYQGNSRVCERIASELKRAMDQQSQLFQFRRSEECVLLLVDRCDDLVTPLLTQWTYEAMIHEYFGLDHHKTTINHNGKSEDMSLIPQFDPFFGQHAHTNWGDICTAVRDKVTAYQQKTNIDSARGDLESMKKVMESMPELKKESISMSKHTLISDAMNRLIKERDLMDVSLAEQEVSTSSAHREHLEQINELMDSPKLDRKDLIRLVMIYMLRYERHKDNQIQAFRTKLDQKFGLDPVEQKVLDGCLKYGGEARRASDLFNDNTLTSRLRGAVRGIGKACENAYTQHEPLLKRTLHALAGGKLSYDTFPCLAGGSAPPKDWKPQEIIIYIAGGLTYEETRTVKEVMGEIKGLKVIVGGTQMLRTSDVVDKLATL